MIYVHCGDNSKNLNIPVNMIISDKSIAMVSFERNLRSSTLCFYYVVFTLFLANLVPLHRQHIDVLNNEYNML